MANLDITKNFAKSTVSTGYDSSATEIVLVSGGGSVFPDPAVSGAFNLLWWDRSTFIDPFDDPNKEIVRCTAINGDTLTVIRAQEGTLATNKNTIGSWYDIALVLTKKTIDDIGTELDAKLEDITSESIGDLSNVDLTGVADGKVLRYNGTSEKFEVSDAGIGDMEASTYDPTEVKGDAFDMDNMAQGTTNKFISAAELTVLQNTSGINTGDQEASDFDIKDLTDSNDLRTTWSGKQDALTFGIADTNAVKIDSSSIADDEFARFTANGLESRSASEVRGDLGLATSDIPQFAGIELGHASDTTITRSGAGVIAVENVNLAKSTMGEDLTTNNFNILRKSIPSADNRGEGDIITDIVAGETLAFPNLVYLKSDGKWWKADADAIASCDLLGLALESKNTNEAVKVLVNGFVRDDDWAWTVGGKIYASTTPAALSQTAVSGEDDVVAIVGYATHANRLYFRPDNTRIEFKA